MGEDTLVATLLDDVARVTLGADDRAALVDELVRADDLRRMLASGA